MFYGNLNKHQAGKQIQKFKDGELKKGKTYYQIELTLLLKNNNKKVNYHDSDFGNFCPSEDLLKEKGFKKVCGFDGEKRNSLYIFKSKDEVLIGKVYCGGSMYYILDLDVYNEFVEKFNFYVGKYDKKGRYAYYTVK